jgi:hypothetical protein
VLGHDFDPDALTERTGIQPTSSERRPRRPPITLGGRVVEPPSAIWDLTERIDIDDYPDPLNVAVERMLAVVEPHVAVFRAVEGARRLLRINYIHDLVPEWGGSVSAANLARIAALDAELSLDFTCGGCW